MNFDVKVFVLIVCFFRFEASINRSLRQHQDEAFLESLRADQEKERRREEQRLAAEAEERRRREVSFQLNLKASIFFWFFFCWFGYETNKTKTMWTKLSVNSQQFFLLFIYI